MVKDRTLHFNINKLFGNKTENAFSLKTTINNPNLPGKVEQAKNKTRDALVPKINQELPSTSELQAKQYLAMSNNAQGIHK